MFRLDGVVGGVAVPLNHGAGNVVRACRVQRHRRDQSPHRRIDRVRQIPVVHQSEQRVDISQQVERVGGEIRPHLVLSCDVVGGEPGIGRSGGQLGPWGEKSRKVRKSGQETPVGAKWVARHDKRDRRHVCAIGVFGSQGALLHRGDNRALGVAEYRRWCRGILLQVQGNLRVQQIMTDSDRVVERQAEQTRHGPELLGSVQRRAVVPGTDNRMDEFLHHLADPVRSNNRFESPIHDQSGLGRQQGDAVGISEPRLLCCARNRRSYRGDDHLGRGDRCHSEGLDATPNADHGRSPIPGSQEHRRSRDGLTDSGHRADPNCPPGYLQQPESSKLPAEIGIL